MCTRLRSGLAIWIAAQYAHAVGTRIAVPLVALCALVSSCNPAERALDLALATTRLPTTPGVERYFSDWPKSADPKLVGQRLLQQFVGQASDGTKHYKEACAWYGALRVAALLGDSSREQQLVERYRPYRASYDELFASDGHVDQNVFGIVPLELAKRHSEPAFTDDGLELADHQLANLGEQIRFAIDDMYMITGLQMQAYRVSGDAAHLNDAADTMVLYLDALQQADGTFFHRDSVPIRWGRGNGWVASGLTELLADLPPEHPRHAAVLEGYLRMMNGLLAYQIQSGEGQGLWRQVLDYEGAGNWPETSGSAMFTNALITGVRRGLLDPQIFAGPAREAWIALVSYLEPDAKLTNVSNWMYQGDVDRYLARERLSGDNHGQAPMLWTVAALLEPPR